MQRGPAGQILPADEAGFEARVVDLVRVGDVGGDEVGLLILRGGRFLCAEGRREDEGEQGDGLYYRMSHGSARVVTKKNVTKLISAGVGAPGRRGGTGGRTLLTK